jgi:hypothetical protein
MSSTPLFSLQDELARIINEAEAEGILLRLLGGLAVQLHSPSASHRELQRTYPDLDFITDTKGGQKLPAFLSGLGYTPDKRFNTLNGDRRQLYFDDSHGRQIDIFVGAFEMCHKLPLAARLAVESPTIPLAELMLTKAQIVELNRKDVLDLLALFLDHPVGLSDEETINQVVVAELCGKDWGLYTTLQLTLEKLRAFLGNSEVNLSGEELRTLAERFTRLETALDEAPKTAAWKLRARVGKRMRWYEEVEEVQR